MMRTLMLIRHAKSSWKDPGLDDFDRPLNKRGNRDAPEMGKRLRKSGYFPDLMMTSPARRAMDTCTIIASELGYPQDAIKTDERLYLPGSTEFLEVIRGIDDTMKNIAVFSHNPGITHFANRLNNVDIDNIPTCGMVHCFFDLNQWKDLAFATGRMHSFDYPKNKR